MQPHLVSLRQYGQVAWPQVAGGVVIYEKGVLQAEGQRVDLPSIVVVPTDATVLAGRVGLVELDPQVKAPRASITSEFVG